MYSSDKKRKVLEFLKQNKISENDYCLIGSSIMEEYGLREANDIDMLVSSSVLSRLKQEKNYKTVETIDGISCFEFADVELKESHHLRFSGVSDDEVVSNPRYHVIRNGLKFLRPEILMTSKIVRGTAKDFKDADLIASYFTKENREWDVSLVKKTLLNKANKKEKTKKAFKEKWLGKIRNKLKNIQFIGKRKINGSEKKERTYFLFFIPVYKYLYSPDKQRKKILGLKIWEKKESGQSYKQTLFLFGIPIFKKQINHAKYKKISFIGIPLYQEKYHDFKISRYILGIRYKTNQNNFYNSINYVLSPAMLLANHYNLGKFDLYDTIVRYLAVAYYHGDNKIGAALYQKMQEGRGVWKEHNLDTFKTAIDSIKNNGFDFNRPIELRGSGQISDGSHRFSIALYCRLPFVSAVPTNWMSSNRRYNLDWFKNHNFTAKELSVLEETKKKLFFEYGVYTPIILWGPAKDLFEEIKGEFIKTRNVNIIKEADIKFSTFNEYSEFVRKIYNTDDIAPWKIEKKLTYMIDGNCCVKVLWIEQLYNQSYIRKKDNYHLYSAELYKLKTEIRKKYQNRIKNYFYDVICHMGDNPDQNILINKVINKYIEQ